MRADRLLVPTAAACAWLQLPSQHGEGLLVVLCEGGQWVVVLGKARNGCH